MKKKINIRLIGIALIAILVTLMGVTSIYYYLFENQVRKDLYILADTLVDSGIFEKEHIGDLAFESKEVRVSWIDVDGSVLYDSWTAAENLGNHKTRPEVAEAFEKGNGDSVRTSDTLQMNTYYYALRIADGTVVRVAVNASSGASIFINAMPMVALITVVIMMLCIILANYLTKKIVSPIAALANSLDETRNENEVYKELEPFVQTIRVQHENVLEAAKMRQDFTASVTHELKTPLTAISGYAELIENNMVSGEQAISFAGEINKNAIRLLTLINDIIRLSELDHAQLDTEFETLDLYELAKECAETLQVNASRKNIEFFLEGTSCMMRGNHEMLRELIENLGQNAIRYNEEGGKVEIFAGVKEGQTVLIVKDNGIGIPMEHQSRVFERFYRVDKSRSKATGGTGLGLAIVKHIVAIHEANIDLKSEVGNGTTITVTF